MKNDLNLAICISGSGSTMREILRACKDGRLPHVNPALIISSNPNAGGIAKAKEEGFIKEGITVFVRKNFETREAFGEAILSACRPRGVDLIAQCGFIPIMPDNVIDAYKSMIFNQHPGPLDQDRLGFGGEGGMYGRAVHHAVLHFARRVGRPFRTEATVHRVVKKVDGGAILGRSPIAIRDDEDAQKLADRVIPYEHSLVIWTIHDFAEFGNVREIHRERPLIRPGEESLLEEAKAAGKAAFPNG